MLIDRKELLLKDKKIIVRSADVQDALSLCNHRYITASESYFMSRYPEECSFNEENMKARITETKEDESDFFVTAFYDGKVIGDLGVSRVRNQMKFCHRAYMGISIQKDYCNIGLGTIMVQYAIDQAKLNGFEQLELGVFEDNEPAIHLYEKLGFVKYGIQPRAFKLKDGTYRDEIIMVKML